jgi:hypothetical protein
MLCPVPNPAFNAPETPALAASVSAFVIFELLPVILLESWDEAAPEFTLLLIPLIIESVWLLVVPEVCVDLLMFPSACVAVALELVKESVALDEALPNVLDAE